MKGKLWLLVVVVVSLVSCGPDYIFEEQKAIDAAGWAYTDSIRFEFEIRDTATIYNQSLVVEHSTDYGFQNLYVKVHTVFPDGQRNSQVLSLELANRVGMWFGNCNEESCELNIPIQNNIFFPMTGTYAFILEQYMRKNPLEGLQSFELKIEDTGKKKQ